MTNALLDGLPPATIEKSRYLVNEFNEVLDQPGVFAIGDIALMKLPQYPNGHPGVAQPAIQQGRHLTKNLLSRRPMPQWQPFKYFDKGSLAIIGRRRAVADLPGDWHVGGVFAWLAWLLVHVYYLIGFRSKLGVLANWTYRLFTKQGGTRLIIRPFVRTDDQVVQDLIRRQSQQ